MRTFSEIFNEFSSLETQKIYIPIIIIIVIGFVIYLLLYNHMFKSKIIQSTLLIHGVFESELKNKVHFHNIGLQHKKSDSKIDKIRSEAFWDSKKYLFIPSGKINAIHIKNKKAKIWYSGNISECIEYDLYKLPESWENMKLDKTRIVNYNGTFVLGNLMAKTLNMSSLMIDTTGRDLFKVLLLFDNGSERYMTITPRDFFEHITSRDAMVYNLNFLENCDIIELL